MHLSIVTTLYGTARYLEEFCARACRTAEAITSEFEIILVNDGSPDDALAIALRLQEGNPRLRIVDLSRNFGHHPAMLTGLEYARGQFVFVLDSDLEEEPELLPAFYEEMVRSHADVVYGVQAARHRGLLDRITGRLYYSVFNFLSSYSIPANLVTAGLMTQRYVTSLLQYTERELVLSNLWVMAGYTQVALPIQKTWKRNSSYSLGRRIATAVNAITASSAKPLIMIFYIACAVLLLSGASACYLVVRRLFFHIGFVGWTSLIVSIWTMGGIVIFCLGIIGIYLSKLFLEVKGRPRTIVREIYEWPDVAVLDAGAEGSSASQAGERRRPKLHSRGAAAFH